MCLSPEVPKAVEALQDNYPGISNYDKTFSGEDQERGIEEIIEEVEQPRSSMFDVKGNDNDLLSLFKSNKRSVQ